MSQSSPQVIATHMKNYSQITSSRNLTILDILALLIPCLIFVEMRIIGRLFLPEIILLGLFPFLLWHNGRTLRSTLPKHFLFFSALWFFSQIITDVMRGTPFEDWSRGLSKIVFFTVDFFAIYLIVGINVKRMKLFMIGIAIGQILAFFINPNIFASDWWKFGVGYAITVLLLMFTQFKLWGHDRANTEIILVLLSVLNVFMGARSLGGMCFLTAVLLYAKRKALRDRFGMAKISRVKLFLLVVYGFAVSLTMIGLYGYSANKGWLGEEAKVKYESQLAGELGLLIGGRSEILASSMAIMDSPIIGHGSWAKDQRYVEILHDNIQKYGYNLAYNTDSDHIPSHSYVFGAWVEAGILGAVFWIWFFVLTVKALIAVYQLDIPFAPLIVFICLNCLWNILFSPFGAETRFYNAYAACLIMFPLFILEFMKVKTRL